MRLVTYTAGYSHRLGAILKDMVVDVNAAYSCYLSDHGEFNSSFVADRMVSPEIVKFLEGGAASLEAAKRGLNFVEERWGSANHLRSASGVPAALKLDQVKLEAPIPRPPKIICVRTNYPAHRAESRRPHRPPPEKPSFFAKFASCVIGPSDPIILPKTSHQVDYEGELAFVIGKRAKEISYEQAMDHVVGYTIFHDVSARDIQLSDPQISQIIMGKNFDTSAPMGPYLTLKDEVPDPHKLRVRTWVNNRLLQDGNTKDFYFDIPSLVSLISQANTLEPGDVVSTGTPAGVGVFREPPIFLQPGDVVRIEIEGLGVLENPVVGSEGKEQV